MKEFLVGLAVGGVLVLFLEVAALVMGLKKAVQKRGFGDTYHKRVKPDYPSRELLDALRDANKCVRDVAWINVLLQRFFYELSRSQTFKEKMKSIMVSKIGIAFSSGILKRVRFREVDMGAESPYIRGIKALSEEEVSELFRTGKISHVEEDRRVEEDLTRRRDGSESRMSGEWGANNKRALFKQVYLLIDIHYSAVGNCVYIDADLIKGYSIPAILKIHPFTGQIVLRLPANNYSTRMELCFVGNPGFDFTVEASVSKNDSMFFTKSVSSILKKLFKYMMSSYIYPNWYYYYLPMLVSRAKSIKYPYYPVTSKSRAAATLQAREVSNLFSLDYKILSKKDSIVFRRSAMTVNSTEIYLYKAEIPFPGKSYLLLEENFYGAPNLGSAAVPQSKSPVSSTPSPVRPFVIDIFKDVISDYEGCRVIETYDPYISRIHLTIRKEVFEFTRIQHNNLLIYQLADPREPFFVGLRMEEEMLEIVQFTAKDSPFRLTRFRISKLKSLLEKQPLKMLGSTSLFRFMELSMKGLKKARDTLAGKKELKKEGKEDVTQDISKMQYISDEAVETEAGSTLTAKELSEIQNVSESNIIESHFISEESKLLNSLREPSARIEIDCAPEELFSTLLRPEVRLSLFNDHFDIMEETHLSDRLISTPLTLMKEGKKKYVQLLTYVNREERIVIERILLSEMHVGKTVILRVGEGEGGGELSVFLGTGMEYPTEVTEALIRGFLAIENMRVSKEPQVVRGQNIGYDVDGGVSITTEKRQLAEIRLSGSINLSGFIFLGPSSTLVVGEGIRVDLRLQKVRDVLFHRSTADAHLRVYLGLESLIKKGGELAVEVEGLVWWEVGSKNAKKGSEMKGIVEGKERELTGRGTMVSKGDSIRWSVSGGKAEESIKIGLFKERIPAELDSLSNESQ
jgi:hypothetical protein